MAGFAINPNFNWARFGGEALQDLGYGLADSSSIGNAFGTAARYGQAQQADRYQQQTLEEQRKQEALEKNQTSEWIKTAYPQYAGLPAAQAWQAAMADMAAQRNAASGANAESFFGTGIPIQNADGTVSYGQFGSHGSFNVPDLPEGSSFLTPVQQINAGTHWAGVDKFGRPMGPDTPIDNFGAEQDKALGKVIGDAAAQKIVGLPQTLATSNNMIGTIDGILNDPALDISTGWLSWMQGVPGTEQYRFGQRALQLQGQAFLQAFESLKGGGQITEVEGAKATQAIGRLSTAQNAADYRAALGELRGIIDGAKQRAISGANSVSLPGAPAYDPRAGGGGGGGPTTYTYNPATGELE